MKKFIMFLSIGILGIIVGVIVGKSVQYVRAMEAEQSNTVSVSDFFPDDYYTCTESKVGSTSIYTIELKEDPTNVPDEFLYTVETVKELTKRLLSTQYDLDIVYERENAIAYAEAQSSIQTGAYAGWNFENDVIVYGSYRYGQLYDVNVDDLVNRDDILSLAIDAVNTEYESHSELLTDQASYQIIWRPDYELCYSVTIPSDRKDYDEIYTIILNAYTGELQEILSTY